MPYYFGFVPSAELNATIDKAYELISSNRSERYDVYRDKITHLTNRELLDTMLVKLIASLPHDSERKTHLIKVSHTIEAASDKLINSVLSPAKNEEVLPSFAFFDNRMLVKDHQGQRRISVPLDDKLGAELIAVIDRVQQGYGREEVDNLTRLFTQLSQACLQHFLLDFTKTLPLNLLKRGAIPVADSVINKVLSVALHRMIPQMPQESLERFATFYAASIFKIEP